MVYTSDLPKFVTKIREQRGVERPFLTVGLDGGQDKCIVVIQMHDLNNPDPTYFKDGGRRRSIIIARGIWMLVFL